MTQTYQLFISPLAVDKLSLLEGTLPPLKWRGSENIDTADAFLMTEEEACDPVFLEKLNVRPLIFINATKVIPEFEFTGKTLLELGTLLESIEPIVAKIQQIPSSNGDDIFLNGLAFLWSRNKEITPCMTRLLEKGYGYPYFDTILGALSPTQRMSGREIFTYLENVGLVTSTPYEQAHSCHKCESVLILLRDSCINCGSPHIEEEKMIHHFTCGFQALEREFVLSNENFQNEYVCPKCRKPLRHYGIDYDKPGIAYRCLNCAHDGPDTQVTFKCVSCQAEGNSDNSSRLTIASYELTSLGMKTLLSPQANIFNLQGLLKKHIDAIDFSTFLKVIHKFTCLRIPLESYVLTVTYDAVDRPAEAIKIMYELGKELAKVIRQSDSISFFNGTLFVFLVECKKPAIEQFIQMKKKLLLKVFTAPSLEPLRFHYQPAQDFINQYTSNEP